MAFLEPSAPQVPSSYRAPAEGRSRWLALAHEIDPEVARYFLVSARCGCFMQAARSLNIKATLLRKRLAQLEEHVRHSLFSYQGNGLVLSRDGQQLHAQLIALAHERRLPVTEQPLIRLAVAEPILHDILGRDLIALLRRNASVRLEIISIDSQLSLQAVDVDVVLWLSDADGPVPGPSFATEPPQALALALRAAYRQAIFTVDDAARQPGRPRRLHAGAMAARCAGGRLAGLEPCGGTAPGSGGAGACVFADAGDDPLWRVHWVAAALHEQF